MPYWGYSLSEKFAQESVGQHPNISRDNVLTVFAQLASLRLNASRALISLFDRTTQHVVAEATPRLGLRTTKSGEGPDALWRGVQQLPREKIPMCNLAMRHFTDEAKETFIVPDLTKDPRFHSASFVTDAPFHRFYISVPIRSPESYIIGSIAVLDDRPRDDITEEQKQLLQELSVTVMEYLLSLRAMREEHREERMVRALGVFVRGKSDLTDGMDSDNSSDKKTDDLAQVNQKLEEVQISRRQDDSEQGTGQESSPRMLNDASSSHKKSHGKKKRQTRSPVRKFKTEVEGAESDVEKEENEQRPSLTPTTENLQKKLAPHNVRSVLNRASCLMDQALDIEGAMFIDASVHARRQVIGPVNDDKENHNDFSTNRRDNDDDEMDSLERPATGEDPRGPRSLVLGYSTTSASSGKSGKSESHYVPLPGSFVNHLIDRYPRGKIFDIDQDGSIALSYEGLADDVSQAYISKEKAIEEASPNAEDVEFETMEINYFHKLLPEARCLAIYPIWDFQRSRWFSVNLVWTNDPGRVLSEPKDLTYMAAFSNSVMAEVSRMDVEAADRAKGDFISSISHELRSPLHGVLGTVELLQETATTYAQRGLVETVYSCGRTLLDTLNHLLDYAKINTLAAPSASTQSQSSHVTSDGDVSQPKVAVPGVVQNEDLSALVQEVVEGLLAGAEFYSRETDSAPESSGQSDNQTTMSSGKGINKSRVMTIVDIEWQDNWRFLVYSGAWRRVVMNLFGNALKYTQTGYIRLFMKKDSLTLEKNKSVPAVRITISDSGRGMSQDFILHHIYTAFVQEDTQSPGLGVGLHLVHQIVKSLGGKIEFKSKIDRGTDVDVILPYTNPASTPPLESSYHALRRRLSGMTVSFFTRSSQRGDLGIKSEVFDNIRFSLGRMVNDWFGLTVLSSNELEMQTADFLIVTEHEYREMACGSAASDIRNSIESKSGFPLIVLSERASSWKVTKENTKDRAIFLAQP